mmetsp:Transcript_28498/g.87275  ORF Transcript_28498/g.87275 Transcript_28498/m.87275 type:complete len:438 (+) Transcript_28498:743-2056(+)
MMMMMVVGILVVPLPAITTLDDRRRGEGGAQEGGPGLGVALDDAGVVEEVEAADGGFVALEVAFQVEDVEDVVEHVGFEVVVVLGVGAEGGTGVDFDEPGLEVVVDEDVVSVEFEAVLVGDHDVLDREERAHDESFDGQKEFVDGRHAVARGHQKFERPEIHFAAAARVVVVGGFLDGDVGQVHEVVGDVGRIVPRVREPREAASVQVRHQRREGRDEDVQAHVELLVADQVRVFHVALHDVRFRRRRLVRLLSARGVGAPVGDLGEARKEKDASALRRADRFHDPDASRPFELFHEQRVLARQHETERREVVRSGLVGLALSLKVALHPLQVLHQQVLPTQLPAVPKMVDALVRLQVRRVENLVGPLALGPVDVPVAVALGLPPVLPRVHHVVDRVSEARPELYRRPVRPSSLGAARHFFVACCWSCWSVGRRPTL